VKLVSFIKECCDFKTKTPFVFPVYSKIITKKSDFGFEGDTKISKAALQIKIFFYCIIDFFFITAKFLFLRLTVKSTHLLWDQNTFFEHKKLPRKLNKHSAIKICNNFLIVDHENDQICSVTDFLQSKITSFHHFC